MQRTRLDLAICAFLFLTALGLSAFYLLLCTEPRVIVSGILAGILPPTEWHLPPLFCRYYRLLTKHRDRADALGRSAERTLQPPMYYACTTTRQRTSSLLLACCRHEILKPNPNMHRSQGRTYCLIARPRGDSEPIRQPVATGRRNLSTKW